MKKVSVIVPVYNVEKFLKRCLNSLVNQTLKDIEIIIINDGSKDNSQAIIDEYKAKYPDIIKAYYVENGGVAKARNYALNYVTGEYIGFVDSDDYVSEEMYEKLYNKAIEKNADIVCCNYYRVIDNEKFILKKFGNSRIDKDELFDKSVYEANLLFDEVPYLWNKIFKAEIIKNNNFKFYDDLRIYEDFMFTYQAFSKANKISRIEEGMYYYMVSRESSLTYFLTEKRFDLFKVTERLINYYKEIGRYKEVEEALFYAVLKHIYVIFEKRTRKGEKKLKKKYINTAFDFLNKNFPMWKKDMYFELQNKDKKLYRSKLYWKLCATVGFNIIPQVRKLKRKIKKLFKFITKRVRGNIYIKNYKKPIDSKSVFIFPQQGNNLNGNMFYLAKELATNKEYNDFTIYIGYSNPDKENFKKLLEHYNILKRVKLVKKDSTKFVKKLAVSKYLMTDTSMPIYFIKRNEQVYLNTWHGTPLKTLGKSTENDFFDIANVQKNFVISDYLLYPNEYMKNIMIEDYMLKGIAHNKIMLCGYPRNEIFLREDVKETKEKYGVKNKELIAYMPTWRGSVRKIDVETQLNIAETHIRKISEKLKENQILYVNMHPYIKDMLDLGKYDNVKQFPQEIETYDFLSICDILITDYSSVFFDFAITKKKIILFTYDEEEYFKDRGVYFSLNELPFPKVKSIEDLIKEINSPIKYDISEFLNKFCQYEKNNISKLICEKILLNKQNEIKILDMPKSDKSNVLLYVGNFRPNDNTREFIKIVNNTKDYKYNYYVSYVTKNIRPNKDVFRKIVNKVNFYGQLGNNTNLTKLDIVLIKLLGIRKGFYNKFEKKYHKMHQIELDRIFNGITFKAAVFSGDINYKKIYQLSDFPCKTILYVKQKKDFNTKINKKVYNNINCIATTNKETYDIIKAYCGQENNIKLIDKIDKLEDLEKLIV